MVKKNLDNVLYIFYFFLNYKIVHRLGKSSDS